MALLPEPSSVFTTNVGTPTWDTNAPGTSDFEYRMTSYTDPTTGAAWVLTGPNSLSNMQIGVIITDANPDGWISTIWALVEYVPVTSRVIRLHGVRLHGVRLQ